MAFSTSGSTMRRITDRLSTYRPVFDRVVFGLAMLGLLTSAHIAVQQQRGFDQGCTGFSTSLFAGSSFDCGAVTSSEASTLLGVSNSVWGVLFYVLVATLTAVAASNWKARRAAYRGARALLVAAGFIYSLYLVYYQFFILEELCALCLLSAGVVTAMLLIHIVDINRSESHGIGQPEGMTVKPSREMAYMGALVVLVGLLIGADALYFNNLEAPDVFAEEVAQAEMEDAGPTSVERTASDTQPASLPAACTYDLEKGRVEDHERLVNFFDPTVGDPAADVTVIEFFDPNCLHCKTFHDVVMPVVRSHSDQARFVFKPFVLWRHSVAQSEALYAAAQEGKFFEMLDAQFAMQNPQTGLGPEQLRGIAEEIGMNAAALMQRLESGIYQTTLAQEKQKAVEIGVNSTPTVLINGRFLAPEARTVECLRKMIEEAGQG